MKSLIPHWHVSIRSSLQPDQAAARLSRIVTAYPLPSWGWDSSPYRFTGTVTEQDFRIRRIIHYRNSFLPTLSGHFVATPGGSLIHIQIRLHPVLLVLALGLSLWWLYVVVDKRSLSPLANFIRPFSVVFLVFSGGFVLESVIALRQLKQLFAATPVG